MSSDQRPVKPADLVVKTVTMVVAKLGAPHFVAHYNHGNSQREHGDCQKILYLSISQLFYRAIVRGPFDATVPASVVVRAVAVVLAIGLVVLLVIRDKVVESEAIVTCHEIDALFRFALLVTVKGRTAQQPVGHARHRTVFTAEEAADVIAKASVPLLPTVTDKAAHLIKSSRIPGLGEELGPRKCGV